MRLKELIQLKEVQDHFGIEIREEYPFRATLKFAEDISLVGIDIDKNRIAVVPYYDGNLHNIDIPEILCDYNIIDCLTPSQVERKEWDLECTWLENDIPYEEMSELELEDLAKSHSILILELKWSNTKLELKECEKDGGVSEV